MILNRLPLLILLLIPAFFSPAAYAVEQPADLLLLNDPAPRSDLLLTLREAELIAVDRSILPAKKTGGLVRHVLTGRLRDGKTVLGKLRLDINAANAVDSLRIAVYAQNEDEEILAAQQVVSPRGLAELNLGGLSASAIKVMVENYPGADNPIADVQLSAITAGSATKIMLIGDSITKGKGATDTLGYRHKLYDDLARNGHNIDFVGLYGAPPYEGHFQSGASIQHFLNGQAMDVRAAMNLYRPQIVAIHLGTNNINNDRPPAETTQYMQQLINYLLQWRYDSAGNLLDPTLRLEHILVSVVIPIKYGDELVIETNRQMARVLENFRNGIITGRAEPITIVDQFSRFRETPPSDASSYFQLMADWGHPNDRGHQLLADNYEAVLAGFLTAGEEELWFSDITFAGDVIGTDFYFPDSTTTVFYHQGIAIADATGDGFDDIYLTRSNYPDGSGHDNFYVRNEHLPFIDKTDQFDLNDPGGSRGAVFVDYDNDGDFDLFNGNSPGGNKLYKNQSFNSFQNVTTTAGIQNLNRVTTGVAAFDANNDGHVDLYAVNSRDKNELYINKKNGTFALENRGLDDAVEPTIPSHAVAPADFDNDGDTDVFVIKQNASNKLFVNDGTGNFTDGTSAANLYYSGYSGGATWTDLDVDGDLDLVISESQPRSLRIYENLGDGRFSFNSSINIAIEGFSAIVADFNNDGFDDILATFENAKAHLWENHGNFYFAETPATGAEINAGDIRGAVAFDYDNDGDMDILAARSDMLNVLLQNNYADGNTFLKIKAFGPNNNLGGFGTKIWLYQAGHLNDPDYLLGHREIVSSAGHLSQPSPTRHFGLAGEMFVDLVARFNDGSALVLRQVAANQIITIRPSQAAGEAGEPASLAFVSGNNQQGIVGQQLALPLEVKVADETGLGVPEVAVSFAVTQGLATLFLPNATADKISLEAENGQFQTPLRRAAENNAAGGEMVFKDPFASGNGSTITWQKDVSAGQYYLWLRLVNTSESVKYLSLTVDGGSARNIAPAPGQWQWLKVSNDNLFDLTTGAHTFVLSMTDPGVQVDKLLLVQDDLYVPTGLEDAGAQPDLTDSQGIARRYVQLDTLAGAITVQASFQINGQHVPGSPVLFQASANPGAPMRIAKTSGDHQSGPKNVVLPQPLVVTVYDVFNNPVPGVSVSYSTAAPNGHLSPASPLTTDANGRVSVSYTPDASSSLQLVEARANGLPPVTFSVYVSGVAVKMELLSQSAYTGTVKQVLAAPIRVKVLTDSLTNQPAANYNVQFSTNTIGGRLSSSTNFNSADSILIAPTDAAGIAQVYWQLGQSSGAQTVVVNAGVISGSPKTIAATAAAESPALLLRIDGNDQTGAANTALAKPFKVRVTDIYRNPVAGVQVKFTSETNGAFSGASSRTETSNSAGEAAAVYTLGTLTGHQRVANAAASKNSLPVGSPVDFYATVSAGAAATAAINGGDGQSGLVNTALVNPLAIIVRDLFGNPAPGFAVTFTALDDGTVDGQSSIVKQTNAQGVAQVNYVLGRIAGDQRVQVDTPGLNPALLQFIAHAAADAPTRLNYVSGNNQTGATNTRLPDSLVVRVTDRYGNGVANQTVTFIVTSAKGSIDGGRQAVRQTNVSGYAWIFFTLGNDIGNSLYTLEAHSDRDGSPLVNSPVGFAASASIGQPHAVLIASDTTNLVGAAHRELPQAITAKIVDKDNQPIADFNVTFRVIAGFGNLKENGQTTLTVPTNADGEAAAHWVLGELGIPQKLWIMATHSGSQLVNSPLTVSAHTVAAMAKTLVYVIGNNQSAARQTELPEPLRVKILDTYAEPLADHNVAFVRTKGDGYFSESSSPNCLVKTNSGGLAEAHFVLGDSVGANAYEIQARSFDNSGVELENSPFIFYAAGEARELVIVSGDGQSQRVTTTLAQPLRVRLVDENNNGIAGKSIAFSGSGDVTFLNPSPQTTDGQGYAQMAVKFGARAGKKLVTATAVDHAAAAGFGLTALPDVPAKLVLTDGDAQVGVTWHELNQKIAVRLSDRYDNGIGGETIDFRPLDGHGFIFPAGSQTTDSTGGVTVAWALGPVTPAQYLLVSAAALDTTLTITAAAHANQAPQIVAADSFIVVENSRLEFNVLVTDAENDSCTVAMQNLPAGATFNAATNRFSWTPDYDQAGNHWLILQASDEFNATSTKTPKIRVINNNRAPVISLTESLPQEHWLGKIQIPGLVDFYVQASDPDDDNLLYLWKVNGKLKGTSPNFQLNSQLYGVGAMAVEALVFDQSDTAKTTWTFNIVTSVELKSFAAAHEPYSGVRLKWQTRYEWDNKGFYVLRSERQDGPFIPISPFIESKPKGEYEFLDDQVESGAVYFYRLQDVQSDGARHESENIRFEPPLPVDFALKQNYPNPFNPTTTIRFDVAKQSHVLLIIYDILGRRVRTLFDGEFKPGFHKVEWDSRNDYGSVVASGVYHTVLLTEGGRFTTKMLLLH